MCGKMLQWIAAFLDGRRQRVIVNGSKSSWSPVTSGIPQGMYLAKSMPEVVDLPVHVFSDDAKIYRHITTKCDKETLQEDIK